LIDLDFDVELTGFDSGEIDVILEDGDEAKKENASPEDRVPEPRPGESISRPGDLWVMGKHRLLCGDARDHGAYQLLLDGEKAELIFADPPYNVTVDGIRLRPRRRPSSGIRDGQWRDDSRSLYGISHRRLSLSCRAQR